MKTEFILAVRSEPVAEHVPTGFVPAPDLNLMSAWGAILQREYLETCEDFRQLIVYIVMVKPDGSMFVYQRAKGTGEGRLLGKHSVGIGGHVDAGDVVYNELGAPNIEITLRRAACRELFEEVEGDVTPQKLLITNVLNDPTDNVGRVHLGMVIVANVAQDYQVRLREEAMVSCGFMPREQILAECDLENWSRILVEGFVHEPTTA